MQLMSEAILTERTVKLGRSHIVRAAAKSTGNIRAHILMATTAPGLLASTNPQSLVV